jgi:osmotically-inducible protein OsmY
MRETRDETRNRWRTDDDREYGHRRRFQDFDDQDDWAERGQEYGRGQGYRQGMGYGGGQGYSYDQPYGRSEDERQDWRYGQRGSRAWGSETGSERYGATTPYGGGTWGRGYPGPTRDGGQRGSWSTESEQRGQFAGRGPKGYRRSDERIREDVSDRLADDSWLDASEIEVAVEGAMVTLSGKVDSRDDKRRAEDLAVSVSGVRDVINQIHVEQGLMDQIEDALTGGREKR